MRLCRPIALGITATAVALAPAASAPAAAHREPACEVAPGSGDFPVRAAIHDGPDSYHPGGDHRSWSLDLTNATSAGCDHIHPVLVLVDGRRTLRPHQIRLEFSDGTRQRPVTFEKTGRHENVGVFDDGFPGFSVGAGETVTVRARLAFTSDTRPDHVTARAALVQRRADDGDWVGESRAYPFDIVPGDGSGDGDGYHDSPGSALAGELARTGPSGALLRLGGAAGACLVGGAALVLGSRRTRPGRR
ncbi:hypothetical protein [Streptomyces sp. NPDC050264]|uniref:hypothetical protein n=1 Tax=Streptomyces sp. NPDC050264 TaxID=3155038 RepID=UPI00343EEDDC